ncbi:MAG: class I SAM-dependent methyltransferase [Rhodospirillaceae bacterium]
MSRLDSFIRRVAAQRDCLNLAAGLVAGVPGPVLELGLGNGRTFDHLRSLFPDREIFVFDRRVAAHPDCIPDDAHLFLGDIAETLPAAGARIGAKAALAHCDMGTGEKESNARLAAFIAPAVAALMAPGGIVVSDQEYVVDGWTPLPLPDGVRPGRYFINRVGG